jgi:hypothetical protein
MGACQAGSTETDGMLTTRATTVSCSGRALGLSAMRMENPHQTRDHFRLRLFPLVHPVVLARVPKLEGEFPHMFGQHQRMLLLVHVPLGQQRRLPQHQLLAVTLPRLERNVTRRTSSSPNFPLRGRTCGSRATKLSVASRPFSA